MNVANNDYDYLEFFGLEEAPFALTPDPAFLFPTEDNQTALRGICTSIKRGDGYAVMTGGIGTGKTTLCRTLLRLLQPTAETAFIINPFLNEVELLRAILSDLGPTPEQNDAQAGNIGAQELIERINDFLIESHRNNRRCVVVIDEAHNLPISTLEQLRILGNIETDKEKLLQTVLVGQDELLELLSNPSLNPLQQRIANWYHLQPLSAQQMEPYFRFRLEQAGLRRELKLSPRAAALAYKLTQGFPRLMNILFDRTLRELHKQCKWEVDEKDVRKASAGVPLERSIPTPPSPAPKSKKRRRTIVTPLLIAAAVVLGSMLGFWTSTVLRPDSPLPAKQAPAPADKLWTLSVGSFETKEEAEQAVRNARSALAALPGGLQGEGYVVTLLEQNGDERYLAAIGKFRKKETADSAGEQLKAHGFRCEVVEGESLKIPPTEENE